MKTLYVVSYDLKKQGQNYPALYKAIKDSGEWLHPLESTWFVYTTTAGDRLRDSIGQHLDSNDKLVVLKVATPGGTQGFTQTELEWINARIGV
ncbi:MAG: hypothetical protein WAW39_21725 [Prosthecobacter sp.]|uniref:hypothetical protein n=1 Tax=Prosthecobacter sp. TaxID=1965333 RepID=UPI003BAF021A